MKPKKQKCNYTRLDPKSRKNILLETAVTLAAHRGYNCITCAEVAEFSQVSRTLVLWYFKNKKNLKKEIVRYAIKNEVTVIIAQGLAAKDPIFAALPATLKQKAITLLAK